MNVSDAHTLSTSLSPLAGLVAVAAILGLVVWAAYSWRRGKLAQQRQNTLAEALAQSQAHVRELEHELARLRPRGDPSGPYVWSEWRKFPDPRHQGLLTAPFGPGCYELRHGEQFVLYGRSRNVAARMSSLLAPPLGCGTRHNDQTREYVREHLTTIEYRTMACTSEDAAREQARQLPLLHKYLLSD